jgi:hypothetical protein
VESNHKLVEFYRSLQTAQQCKTGVAGNDVHCDGVYLRLNQTAGHPVTDHLTQTELLNFFTGCDAV